MSVEVRYHVIREGNEIAVYTSKKEADAHDKMLDIAESLADFIRDVEMFDVEDDVLEELCIHLSKNRDSVIRLLRGQKLSLPTALPTTGKTEKSKSDRTKKESAVPSKEVPPKTSKPMVVKKEKAAAATTKKRRRT